MHSCSRANSRDRRERRSYNTAQRGDNLLEKKSRSVHQCTLGTRYRYSITYSVKGIRTRVTDVPCYLGHGLQVIVTVCIEYSKTHNYT